MRRVRQGVAADRAGRCRWGGEIAGRRRCQRRQATVSAARNNPCLDEAYRQEMLSWELRAATSLVRLLRRQEHPTDAVAHLRPVYDRFTEGLVPPILSRRNDYWMSWGIVGSRLVKRSLSWCLSVKAQKARAERAGPGNRKPIRGNFRP